jgi:hypothetical protein
MKKNIFWIIFSTLSAASISYLYTDAINVFIDTNSAKQEIFYINTSINYSEILTSSTRGRARRLIKSGSVQRVPIHLDNIIFFSHIFASVYHPDYVFQQKQYAHRSIFRSVDFPTFTAKSWKDVMANNIKIIRSSPPTDTGLYHEYQKAIESGEIIRIVDVVGHLKKFKEDYIPLFLEQGTKKQLRRYLPNLEAIMAYAKANIKVNNDQLDEYDRNNIRMMDQELREINVLLGKKEENHISNNSGETARSAAP